MLRCCLNPKIIGGLVVAGILAWLFAPAAGAAAVPALILLICPLSMGIMAWEMHRKGSSSCAAGSTEAITDVDAELRLLREEVNIARARQQLRTTDRPPIA